MIKDTILKLKAILHSWSEDKQQSKALGNIVRFFAIMLVLTFLARGTAGATLAKVTLIAPTAGSVTNLIEVDGKLELANNKKITAPLGLQVVKLLLEPGERIEALQPLVLFEKESTDMAIKTAKAELNKLNAQYSTLQKKVQMDDFGVKTAQDNLDWEKQNQNSNHVKNDATIEYAQRKYDAACSKLRRLYDDIWSNSNELMAAQERLDKAIFALQTAKQEATSAAISSKELVINAETAFSNAQADYEKAKTQADEDAIDISKGKLDQARYDLQLAKQAGMNSDQATTRAVVQAEETLKIAQENNNAVKEQIYQLKKEDADAIMAAREIVGQAAYDLQAARQNASDSVTRCARLVANAEAELAKVTDNYEKCKENATQTDRNNSADAQLVLLNMNKKMEIIKDLQKLQKDNYFLLAPYAGKLEDWNVSVGQDSVERLGTISDESEGYIFTFPLTKEQSDLVHSDTKLSLTQKINNIDATVSYIIPQSDDNSFKAVAKIPNEQFRSGPARATITLSENDYPMCIPSTAVHHDNNGTFVYVVEEKNTILGLQNVVLRMETTILEQSDNTAAISGSLTPSSRIIISATKAVKVGDRVRIVE